MKLLAYNEHPVSSLLLFFIAWKSFLLAIAVGAAIGRDYDTSTSLFFERLYGAEVEAPALATRLTRWDALYFIHASHSGYDYEQQWAFGVALPLVTRCMLRFCQFMHLVSQKAPEPLLAIGFNHITHLMAVVSFYKLTNLLFNNRRLAYVSSMLHILSPGGLFLSAPNPESAFACLSFIGNLLFASSLHKDNLISRGLCQIIAGITFGLATTFRSNGLISGMLFATEALRGFLAFVQRPTVSRCLALVPIVLGALFVAAGSIVPQAVAWMTYCRGNAQTTGLRPWCFFLVPSIYHFVQSEYWNNGFLRYWTLNQMPLFLLASPMLFILIKSGLEFSPLPSHALQNGKGSFVKHYQILIWTLAVSQLMVAILAITNFHVQIITRLSSGYPVWYWWVAHYLGGETTHRRGRVMAGFMVMYGTIQGALFASFLPPA